MENKLLPNPEEKKLKTELPKPSMHEKNKDPEVLHTLEGTIIEWNFNKDYIYDGFILESNSEKINVKFPPHLGKQLKDLSHTSNSISVKGVLHATPKGDKEIKPVSFSVEGKEIFDTPPVSSTESPEFVTGEGKVTEILQEKKGEVMGYIIDNKTVIKIPPHEKDFFENKIQVDTLLKFTGIKKADKEGEIKAKNYSIVHPKTITVNDNEYLIK